MKDLRFKNVTIQVAGANGEVFDYHKNNEYLNHSKKDIINIFKLEPLYMATYLEDGLNNPKAFNTCNWNAPFTLCGVTSEDIYDSIAVVNIHLGGDVRGNYSEPYICEDPEAIFLQSSYLDIELSDGQIFSFTCDNGEAYFDFDTFDPYYIDFEKSLTDEQLKELIDKNNL